MEQAYIFDGIRTPIGRYAGGLSSIRADDLAALPVMLLGLLMKWLREGSRLRSLV